MDKLAIVILNWNGKALLERFLPSVMQFSAEASVYVADNASADNSIAFLKEHYPTVKIIQNKENGGYAKGYNDALEHIDAELFCLLNSDVEVTENWLKPILHQFEKNKEVAIIQPKILDAKRKTHFEYAGAGGGYLDKLGYPFCRGRVFDTLEEDKGQYNDTLDIFWASGACLFIKKGAFESLNGFDVQYFAHQEEIDLCWRAQNKGYSIKYVGSSTVYHLGGATLNEMNPKKTFLNFRNSLFSILKNLPLQKAVPILFLRLLLDAIAGIRFLLQFKFGHFWAIIRSHFSFYWYFPAMYQKRKNANYVLNYYRTKSIVWSYFVKQKKKFNILVKD